MFNTLQAWNLKIRHFFQSIAGPFFTSVCRSTRTLWSRHCWDYDNTELTVFFQSCLNTKRPPPHLPFLVCADSQRSGASQLWKLVSMETRVGRRVMMLLAEQQYRINHVLQCVFVCGCVGIQETNRQIRFFFLFKRRVIFCLALRAKVAFFL